MPAKNATQLNLQVIRKQKKVEGMLALVLYIMYTNIQVSQVTFRKLL